MSAHDLLTDRTIIVTGAATGIGQAFAVGCAEQGADVVVADLNPADETVGLIERAGGEAIAVEVDVSDDASTRAMAAAALDRFGRIDGLVNNAAYFREVKLTPVEEIDPGVWDRIFAVNVKGVWQCCKAFLARDVAWMERHVAPEFVRHDPGLPFEVRGPEGVAELHDALLPGFPDMELDLQDLIAEDDKVLVRLTIRATHTGPFGELEATGKPIDVSVLDLFQIQEDRLVEHWALLDNLGMMRQLGALPE